MPPHNSNGTSAPIPIHSMILALLPLEFVRELACNLKRTSSQSPSRTGDQRIVEATTLDIGEVHSRTGLNPSALRYYERLGLIEAAGRNGLRRYYSADVIERLALIRAAQSAGFTLAEAAEFLASTPSDSELRRRMAAKADEVDDRIAELTAVRDQLRHAVRCQSPRLTDCPNFRRYITESLAAGGRPDSPTARGRALSPQRDLSQSVRET